MRIRRAEPADQSAIRRVVAAAFGQSRFDEAGIAALGPLAVAPERQNAGIGAALAGAGVEAMRAAGASAIVVLGHPTYYPRFGFSTAAASRLASPYSGLAAFMALPLKAGALDQPLEVAYPAAFG